MADPIIQSMLAEQAYGPIYSSQYADAAKSARANEIARRIGMDPTLVEAAMPDMMAEDRLQRTLAEARKNEAYSRIMSNWRLAPAAIDDEHLPAVAQETNNHVINLNGIGYGGGLQEKVAAAVGLLVPHFLSGTADILATPSRMFNAIDEIGQQHGSPGMASTAFKLNPIAGLLAGAALLARKPLNAVANSPALKPQTSDRNVNDVLSAADSAPGSLAALGTTLLGGPLAGSALIGAQTFGQSYESGRQEGLTPTEAGAYGGADAAVEVGTEYGPEKLLGRFFGPEGDKGAKAALKIVGLEVGSETLATALQGFDRWYWIDRTKGQSFQDFLSTLPDQERSTVVSVSALLGMTFGAGHVVRKAADHVIDQTAANGVDRVMAAAAKSSTRTSNPSDFEEALNQLVGDSGAENLYIPAAKVQELFQTDDGGVSMAGDPFWGQHESQVNEAAAMGGDIVVPLATAATHLAGTSQWEALKDHVRTRPGGASRAEIKAQPDNTEELAATLAAHLDERLPQLHAERLTKHFASDLGYEGEQADSVSRLLAAGMSQAHAIENAKRASRGEAPVPMDDFASTYLPQATKMTQAEYDAGQQVPTEVTTGASETAAPLEAHRGYVALSVAGRGLTTIEATRIGDFAIHKDIIDGEPKGKSWTITHGPTGLSIGSVLPSEATKTKKGAIAFAQSLHRAAQSELGKIKKIAPDIRDAAASRSEPPEAAKPLLEGIRNAVEKIAAEGFNDTHRRGNISIARDEKGVMTGAIIRAFEAANFSTAVHELGHFFIEDLKRRAVAGDASDQEKADWEAFTQWAKDNGHALKDNTIPTEAHELWARGFERYIYEGKAPSSSLRVLFARMRDFMVSLYRSIRSFNSPIPPEIREVMDRLLASDEEIKAQQEEMKLASDSISELMSESERQAYADLGKESQEAARDKLYERVLSTLKAERDRAFSARKNEIRSEVTAAHDALPIFRALRSMRVGIPQEDGTTQRVSLPREWLADNYGPDIIDKLPKGVPPLVDDNHAVDPEYIASQAGFDSADQMIHALILNEAQRQQMKAGGDNRSIRQATVDAVTQSRVRDEIGDPYENLEEEAQAALANEKEADRLSLELRALARKAGRRPTAWKMASEWARQHVRSKTAKDAIYGASLQMYARNAAKAAREVEEALVKKDYGEAFAAKQRQVLNLALVAQAKLAKDEVDKAVRRMQKIAGRATIKSIDQDYLDQAHQLLEAVDLKTRPQTQTDKRLAFEEWYAKQVQNGIEPVVPPSYRALLGTTNWSRLRIDDLLQLDEAVSQVIELGRLKQRLKDGKKSRDFNAGVAEMQGSGENQPPRAKGKTTDPRRSLPGKIRSWLRSVDAAMLKAEQMATWLDGGDPNGPWSRMLFRPLAEAQGRETDLLRVYTNDINALIKGLSKALARGWTRVVDTPELVIRNPNHLNNGDAWAGTKDQVVMMAMNWGNIGNRQRLLDGFGWDENAVKAVFDRVLTKEDWDFVQGVWDTVEKLWPDTAALEREVNGVVPEKVEAEPVETPHGTYRGGYFPAVYDPTQSTRAAQDEAEKLAPNGAWFTTTTRASSTKERAAQVKGRPLLLSMSVVTRHLGEVIHDITHRQAVSQAKRLLTDPRTHSVISTRLGPEYAQAMNAWLENIAHPNSAFSKDNPALVGLGRYLNKGVSMVGLGFRFSTSLVQLLGIPVAGKILGSKYLYKGISIVTAHPVQAWKEMTKRSAEMRARADTLDATIEDMIRQQASHANIQTIGPKGMEKYAFQGIVWMDMVTTTTVWTGAFNKALDEGMSEEDATFYADKAVRTTQGTGGMKDRSAIQNAHPLVRPLYPFFSYMNALYNMQRDVGRQAAHAKNASDLTEAARQAWWVFAVPMLLQALIFGDGPDPGDDGEVDGLDWAKYLVKSVMLGNLGSIPVLGNIANAIGNGYTYRSTSYQQIGEGLVSGYKHAEKLIAGDESLKGSTVQSVLTTVGLLTAKPLGQIGATSRGLYDYATGEADPQDAGDWYELLTKGRMSDHPTAPERITGESG